MKIGEGAPKRSWARHKTQAVLRLTLIWSAGNWVWPPPRCPSGVTPFWMLVDSGLKPHPVKDSVEVGRLREKIGERAMENELPRALRLEALRTQLAPELEIICQNQNKERGPSLIKDNFSSLLHH